MDKRVLEQIGPGEYPYITTQAVNNSVAGYYNYYTEDGNIIIAESAVAGFCSYQEKPFSASGHIEKLIPLFIMNKYIGLFIVNMIRQATNGRYNYGYKFNQQRIRDTIINLPVTKSGEPDYEFMEQYIKSLPFSIVLGKF